MAHQKKVAILIFAKVSGNLLESLLSFSLVSYYLVIGTVSYHQDVERPTPFVYVAWAASLIGMFYKGVSAMIRLTETDIPEGVPAVIIFALVLLLPFMLIALLPAILIAEDRNGIYTSFCPELISSIKFVVYSVIWGAPMTIYMIYYLWERFIDKGNSGPLLFVNLILPYTLWLSLTQLSIHYHGKFRTEIGLLLCWPGTIAAFVLLVVCSLSLVFTLMYDIAVIFKPSMLK